MSDNQIIILDAIENYGGSFTVQALPVTRGSS